MTLHKSKRYHKKYALKHIIRILHYNISEVLIMKKIYTCMPLKEKHKKLLESSSSNCEFIHLGQIKPSLEQVKDANVIIGNIPVDILKNIPNLEFVNSTVQVQMDIQIIQTFLKMYYYRCLWSCDFRMYSSWYFNFNETYS